MPGLYDDTPGLSDGTGLWRGRLGLFSGASGFINGSGGAYVDLYFSAGTYSVAGNGYTTLGSIPGFTFTAASLRMGYGPTGLLTYGPNNLDLQSQTFDNASWTKTGCTVTANATTAPDGTLTADKLVEGVGGTFHNLSQVAAVIGSPYVVSCYAKAAERTQVAFQLGAFAAYFNLSNGTVVSGSGAGISDAGNGWWRCWLAVTPASTINNIFLAVSGSASYSGDGTSGIFIWGAQLEAVTYQTTPSTYYPTTTAAYYGPRLVYDPVALASLGILVEEARTNLLLQSSNFAVTWATACTITANATTSPDGTSNATLLTSTGGNTCVQSAIVAATSCTYSIYAKKSTGATQANLFYVRNATTATDLIGINFNYDTGAIGYAVGSSGASATSVGNGWWRIVLTVSSGITSGNNITVYAGFAGAATSGQAAFFWQAQLEAGTGASSPIPTTTAAVTRAADVAAVTGLSVPNPHSMAAEWTPGFDNGTSFRRIGALANSGGTSEDSIYHRHTNNLSRIYTSADMDLLLGTANATTGNKAAGRFELNNSAGSLNGAATVAPDTSTTPTTGIDRLLIGVGLSSTGPLNGTVSRIRIYNRALSDAELQAITQSLLLQEDGYSILQEDNSYIWLE
jgi:hypothetical protein